jgi:hypothetical protein
VRRLDSPIYCHRNSSVQEYAVTLTARNASDSKPLGRDFSASDQLRVSTSEIMPNLRGHRLARRNVLSSISRLGSVAEGCGPTRGYNAYMRKHLVLESGPLD